jgi:hypothetical protein
LNIRLEAPGDLVVEVEVAGDLLDRGALMGFAAAVSGGGRRVDGQTGDKGRDESEIGGKGKNDAGHF